MNYFKLSEFTCKCGCGQNHISPDLITRLNKARGIAGIPFIINSGFRCNNHNKAIKGSRKSSHLNGTACDILVRDNQDRERILNGIVGAEFNRIGIADNFIHVDCDPHKAPSAWLYS